METTLRPSKWWNTVWVVIGVLLGIVLGLAIVKFYFTFHSNAICFLSLILLGLIYGNKIDEMKPLDSSLSFVTGADIAASVTIGVKGGSPLFGAVCFVALTFSFFAAWFLTRTNRTRGLIWFGIPFGILVGLSTKNVGIGILGGAAYYVFYGLRKLEARLPEK